MSFYWPSELSLLFVLCRIRIGAQVTTVHHHNVLLGVEYQHFFVANFCDPEKLFCAAQLRYAHGAGECGVVEMIRVQAPRYGHWSLDICVCEVPVGRVTVV